MSIFWLSSHIIVLHWRKMGKEYIGSVLFLTKACQSTIFPKENRNRNQIMSCPRVKPFIQCPPIYFVIKQSAHCSHPDNPSNLIYAALSSSSGVHYNHHLSSKTSRFAPSFWLSYICSLFLEGFFPGSFYGCFFHNSQDSAYMPPPPPPTF